MQREPTVPAGDKPNLYGLDREQLCELFSRYDAAGFHARQVYRWLYSRRAFDTSAWTDLSQPLRERLGHEVRIDPGQVVDRASADDGTVKYRVRLPNGGDVVNVGVIGRPANDGRTEVWYTLIEDRQGELAIEHVPLAYDHQALAAEMRSEGLPDEFVETILTGWWTTCLEILPAKERSRSRY